MDKKKTSTPEQRTLASQFLFQTNASQFYHYNEGAELRTVSKPSVRASLKNTAGPIIHSIGDILDAFIDDPQEKFKIIKSIGSEQQRAFDESMVNTNSKAFQGLVNLSVQGLVQLVTALHPAETEGLFQAAVCAAIQEAEMGLLVTDPMPTIVSKAKEMLKAVPSRSIERRVLCSLIYYAFPKGCGLAQTRFSRDQAKKDAEQLLNGKKIQVPKRSLSRFKTETTSKAVRFLLSTSNISLLSWGTKEVKLSKSERVVLPRLIRKKSIAHLWKDYQIHTKDDAQSFRSSTFFEVARTCTSDDGRLVACVDYVLGNLLNDPIERLQDIVGKFLRPQTNKYNTTTRYITLARNFLKVQFDTHMQKKDGDGFHDIDHALANASGVGACTSTCTVCSTDDSAPKVACNACKFPAWLCSSIAMLVDTARTPDEENFVTHATEIHDEAIQVVHDVRQKFFLYMRHRCRVVCQRMAGDKIEAELKDDCIRRRSHGIKGLIIADWKQKFESMSARETMPENFGKRGMGWHGVLVMFYLWDDQKEEAVRQCMYIDQILEHSNKQDASAVVSMLEAAIMAIRVTLPWLSEAVLSTDNAGCYQSKLLLLSIGILNAKYSTEFFLSRLFHHETQDGKGLVDAHFAVAMRHLKRYMKSARANKIRRINTPRGLGFALAWNNGISNSIIQLIQLDREKLTSTFEVLERACKQIKKFFSRANDVYFERPNQPELLQDFDWSNSENYIDKLMELRIEFSVMAHSGIGRRVKFTVANLRTGKVVPDNEAQQEFRQRLGMPVVVQQGVDDAEDDNLADNNSCGSGEDNDGEEWSDDDSDFEEEESDVDDEGSEVDSIDSIEEAVDSDLEAEVQDMLANDGDLFDASNIEEVRLYSEPSEEGYDAKTMTTGVKVVKTSYISHLLKRRKPKEKRKAPAVDPQEPKRKDAKAEVVREANRLIAGEHVCVLDAKADNHDDLKNADDFQIHEDEGPTMGYARRLGGSDNLFGARYIQEFESELFELYLQGNKETSDKKSPATMLETLKSNPRNLDRIAFPSEYEIRARLSGWISKNIKKTKSSEDEHPLGELGEELTTEAGDPLFPPAIIDWLKTRLYGDIDAMPMHVSEELQHIFDTEIALPDDETIRKKVGYVKRQLKDRAWKNIL
jgi:hypothetical protein